jgi:hypothetical protein
MNVHVAIYEWKMGTPNELVEKLLIGIADIEKSLPAVQIFVGENTSKYGEGYTHAIVVVGASQTDIDAYRTHPDHERLAKEIDGIEAHGVGVDIVNRFG